MLPCTARPLAPAAALKLLLLALLMGPLLAQATMVRWFTAVGPIDIDLYDTATPATVANYLGYVRSGAYNNTFFHRSVPGFVIQGGGYTFTDAGGYLKVPAGPPVVNEFSASRSNLRGTVAMAKVGGNPNSATTEWFFNLANNAANLDNQNGGFTVFGRVTSLGMSVVDAMAALSRVNAGGAFTDLPVVKAASGNLKRENLVMVDTVRILDTSTSVDRIFNYLEALYPQYLKPANATVSGNGTAPSGLSYFYRYYPATDSYVGEREGVIYYLVPAVGNSDINRYDTVANLLPLAAAAGY